MRTRGAELLPGWAGLWATEGFTWSSSGRFKGHATPIDTQPAPWKPPAAWLHAQSFCPPAYAPGPEQPRAGLGEARVPLSEAPFTDQGGDCEFSDYFFCISLTPGEWVSLNLPAEDGRTLGLGLLWRLPEPPAPGRKERGSPSWQLWVPACLFPAPVTPRSPASLDCLAWRCRFIHTSALHSSSLLCPQGISWPPPPRQECVPPGPHNLPQDHFSGPPKCYPACSPDPHQGSPGPRSPRIHPFNHTAMLQARIWCQRRRQ